MDRRKKTLRRRTVRADSLRHKGRVTRSPRSSAIPLVAASGFLIAVTALVFAGRLPFAILALYLGASAVAFAAYGLDKSAARAGRRRTPESTLHLFGLVGGWPGALFAQRVFRHKSSKAEFQRVFWVTVVMNCLGLGWLLTEKGSAFLGAL